MAVALVVTLHSAAAAEVPVIPPLSEHTLSYETIRWAGLAPDGETAVLRVAEPVADLPALLSLLRRESATAFAAFVLLVSVWRIIATLRRGRLPGQDYCRTCVYPVTGLSTTICPECGASIEGRGRRRGVSATPRVVSWMVIAVLACAFAGLMWWKGPPDVVNPAHPRLSSGWVYRILERLDPPWRHGVRRDREKLITVDLATGKERLLRRLGYPPRSERCAGFIAPSGFIVDASSDRRTLYVWDAKSRTLLHSIPYPFIAGPANFAEERESPNFIFPSGWYGAAGMLDDATIAMTGFESSPQRSDLLSVNLVTGEACLLHEHPARGGSIPYPAPAVLAPAQEGRPLRVVRFVTNPEQWTSQGRTAAERDLARVLTLPDGALEKEFPITIGYDQTPAFDARGRLRCTGASDLQFQAWSIDSGARVPLPHPDSGTRYWNGPLALSPDGRFAVLPMQGSFYCLDAETGEILSAPTPSKGGQTESVAWSADGTRVAVFRNMRRVGSSAGGGPFRTSLTLISVFEAQRITKKP